MVLPLEVQSGCTTMAHAGSRGQATPQLGLVLAAVTGGSRAASWPGRGAQAWPELPLLVTGQKNRTRATAKGKARRLTVRALLAAGQGNCGGALVQLAGGTTTIAAWLPGRFATLWSCLQAGAPPGRGARTLITATNSRYRKNKIVFPQVMRPHPAHSPGTPVSPWSCQPLPQWCPSRAGLQLPTPLTDLAPGSRSWCLLPGAGAAPGCLAPGQEWLLNNL